MSAIRAGVMGTNVRVAIGAEATEGPLVPVVEVARTVKVMSLANGRPPTTQVTAGAVTVHV